MRDKSLSTFRQLGSWRVPQAEQSRPCSESSSGWFDIKHPALHSDTWHVHLLVVVRPPDSHSLRPDFFRSIWLHGQGLRLTAILLCLNPVFCYVHVEGYLPDQGQSGCNKNKSGMKRSCGEASVLPGGMLIRATLLRGWCRGIGKKHEQIENQVVQLLDCNF